MIQTLQPDAKSQAIAAKSANPNEKINLLEQNVKALLDQDRNINQEIKEVKFNFELVENKLTNQIQEINVSL